MSVSKTEELKQRVLTCLNKLSDRDTLSSATAELNTIALNLTPDNFSSFLQCLSTTTSSHKSPVRRHSIRLLSLLSTTHRNSLSPHLPKMLSSLLRRLPDHDSSVRLTCVDTISSIVSHITNPPFETISTPLVQAIFTEQDCNVQIGASMCLSAAIEAVKEDVDLGDELRKVVAKFLKLVKVDCFKAKPALLGVIGSVVVKSGGGLSRSVLSGVVCCMLEFLRSEDWAARKAAAEVLGRLALAEMGSQRGVLAVFKQSCVASLESRRFDKVKVVRETMNRSLELWKEVPGFSDEVLPQSQSKSASKGCGNSEYPAVARDTDDIGFETPQQKKTIPTNRTPPFDTTPATSIHKRIPLKRSKKKPNASMFHNIDVKRNPDWKIEIAVPAPPSSTVVCEVDRLSKKIGLINSAGSDSFGNLRFETKRSLFNQTRDKKSHKLGSLKLGSRVVPFHENDYCELDITDVNDTEEVFGNQKEIEDLSLIRKQLLQIEHQQCSLLELLQRFIGSSQSGMNYLEKRVNGLEKALDEMSQDLAASTGRISNDSTGNTCCMLPGAEFISPKFWRRTEAQFSSPRSSFNGRNQSLTATNNAPHNDANVEMLKSNCLTDQHQSSGVSVVNGLGDSRQDLRETLKSFSNKTSVKKNQDSERIRVCNAGLLDGGSLRNCMQQQT